MRRLLLVLTLISQPASSHEFSNLGPDLDPCVADFVADGIIDWRDWISMSEYPTAEYFSYIRQHFGKTCDRNRMYPAVCPDLEKPPFCLKFRGQRDGWVIGPSYAPGCH